MYICLSRSGRTDCVTKKRMMSKTIALVLSSGGARGLAHIGVIEELEKRGYRIHAVAGSSMGALIGGIYAAGELHTYKEWVTSLDRRDVISLLDFTISAKGMIKGERVLNKMKTLIPDRQIEDLPLPFVAVSTDIVHNKEILHQSGSLYEALRASISIPTIFMPFEKGGTHLVDGGVVNPVPLDRVKRQTDDLLVGCYVNYRPTTTEIFQPHARTQKLPPHKDQKHPVFGRFMHVVPKNEQDKLGYFNLMNRSIGLALNRIARLTIEKYPPDMMMNIHRDSFGTYEFHRADEIIAHGRKTAARIIDAYEKKQVAVS